MSATSCALGEEIRSKQCPKVGEVFGEPRKLNCPRCSARSARPFCLLPYPMEFITAIDQQSIEECRHGNNANQCRHFA